jgi:hypothetical protein
MPQWLGLASPLKWGALYFFDQFVDALKDFSISPLPIEVIIPSMLGEDELHSINSLAAPPPDSSSAMDSKSLRAFLGLLRRYAVSSRA